MPELGTEVQRSLAATALVMRNFSVSAEGCAALNEYATRTLVEMLRCEEAAGAACAALSNITGMESSSRNKVCEAGAIPPLVQLVSGWRYSEVAANAAGALCNLAVDSPANKDAIREAGALPPLVVLLLAGPGSGAAEQAATGLCNLAKGSPSNQNAIREAGAIPPLVALLSAGVGSEASARAAAALRNLAMHSANHEPMCEAGAISPLVALLASEPGSRALADAEGALRNMSLSAAAASSILAAVADAAPPVSRIPNLAGRLRSTATILLQQAAKQGGEFDVDTLRAALAGVTYLAVEVDASTLLEATATLFDAMASGTRHAEKASGQEDDLPDEGPPQPSRPATPPVPPAAAPARPPNGMRYKSSDRDRTNDGASRLSTGAVASAAMVASRARRRRKKKAPVKPGAEDGVTELTAALHRLLR